MADRPSYTYKPTPPGPAFFVLLLRESSWSRLCFAAASCRAASGSGGNPRGPGSVPPTPSAPSLPMSTSSCFAELVSIGPLPLTWPRVATLAETTRTPAAISPLRTAVSCCIRPTGRLRQVRKSCSVAVAADLLTQGAGGLRRFASPAFPQSTSSCCAELVSCGPLPLLVSADGHAPGPLATKASDIPLCFSPVSPSPVRRQQTSG